MQANTEALMHVVESRYDTDPGQGRWAFPLAPQLTGQAQQAYRQCSVMQMGLECKEIPTAYQQNVFTLGSGVQGSETWRTGSPRFGSTQKVDKFTGDAQQVFEHVAIKRPLSTPT